jgi:hypothetical protein
MTFSLIALSIVDLVVTLSINDNHNSNTQHNNTQHDNTQHNNTQHNNSQNKNIQYNDLVATQNK